MQGSAAPSSPALQPRQGYCHGVASRARVARARCRKRSPERQELWACRSLGWSVRVLRPTGWSLVAPGCRGVECGGRGAALRKRHAAQKKCAWGMCCPPTLPRPIATSGNLPARSHPLFARPATHKPTQSAYSSQRRGPSAPQPRPPPAWRSARPPAATASSPRCWRCCRCAAARRSRFARALQRAAHAPASTHEQNCHAASAPARAQTGGAGPAGGALPPPAGAGELQRQLSAGMGPLPPAGRRHETSSSHNLRRCPRRSRCR